MAKFTIDISPEDNYTHWYDWGLESQITNMCVTKWFLGTESTQDNAYLDVVLAIL